MSSSFDCLMAFPFQQYIAVEKVLADESRRSVEYAVPNILVDKFTCGRLAGDALIQTISQYQAVPFFQCDLRRD